MVAIVQGKSGVLVLEDRDLAYYLQKLISFFDVCYLLTANGFTALCICHFVHLHPFGLISGLLTLQPLPCEAYILLYSSKPSLICESDSEP